MKKLLSLSLAIVMLLSCVLGQTVFTIAAGDAVDYNDAPYAGVYAVSSNVATTVTTEIGSVTNLAAGETGYIYLVKGANDVNITNGATLTITDLDDNGLEYLSQVNIPTEPVLFGQEDEVASNLYKTLVPGESYTFTYTPSQGLNGIVYPYLYFSDTVENTYEVTSDTGFITTIYKPNGYASSLAWSDAARAETALLYIRSGAQEITIKNIGSNTGMLNSIKIHSVGEYQDFHGVADLTPLTLAQLNPTPEPTAEPTSTPEPTMAPDTVSYKTEAAGVYEVTSDVDVVLESELGSKAELAAGETGYIYLVRGSNKIATSDLTAELTFTALENNGLDYLDQITEGTLPKISGQEDLVSSAMNKELAPGETYTFTYTPSKGMAGLAYPYIFMSDTNESTIRVVSDTGFYVDIMKPAGNQGTLCWADAAREDFEFLYIKAGTNVFSIENIGANPVTLATINIHSAGELKDHATWGSQITLDNLKVYTEEFPTIDYGYFPEGWDGTLENHPDYNADAEIAYLDAFTPNMSSEEGVEVYGTDFGWGDTSPEVMNKGQAEGVYLPAGSYMTFTLDNVPYAGTYTAMIRVGNASGQTANVLMSNNIDGEDYYADFPVPNGANWIWAWSYGLGIDDFMYLQEGTNHITVYNQGPGGVVYYNNSFGALNNQEDYFQYVGTSGNENGSDPEGWIGHTSSWPDWKNGMDWNNGEVYDSQAYGVCNTALTYDTLNYMPPYTDNGVLLSDKAWMKYTVYAPQSGMYLAVADATGNTLHIETDTGNYADFEAGSTVGQYIYLEEGDNLITATGNNGCVFNYVEFYPLNNSEDYESQKQNNQVIPTEPFDLTLSPNQDMKSADGYWYAYTYDLEENAIVQGAGSVVKYEMDVMFPGIYRVQARIGGTTDPANLPIVTIDTDGGDGYRANLSTVEVQDQGEWRSTDANGNYQYVYLKEGINHVEITAGSTHHVLWGVEFKLLTEEEKATITIDDCMLTPPKPIVINPYTDSITANGSKYDYWLTNAGAPVLGSSIGCQLLAGCWQRFEVTAKVAGTYQISTTANVYNDATTILVETKDSVGKVQYTEASGGYYKNTTGGYITLQEGVNSVWVRNDGPGWVYLQSITLNYVEDTSEIAPGTFVQAHNYIGRNEDITLIPEYTVRNNYYGIHVANANDATANTLTYQYKVNIPADDYYGIVMTGTVPLTPMVTVTLSDGVNDDIVMVDGELPFFGNENQAASVTITSDKAYLAAGEYTMTFTLTENSDAGTVTEMMTHVHGFEFTTLTRQDLFLAAMQSAETTADIKATLESFRDVLTSDITATPDTDFIYPEYAYSALLNCSMLETGAYETYEDVKTAYDFAKNMISAADDGSGNLVYTVQVGDWNEVNTTVLVAVYTGENHDQLYMMGEGYLDYTEANGVYVPVEATLYDYIPESGDVIKVFIWDSFEGLKPVF